jgi:hypothetical protein
MNNCYLIAFNKQLRKINLDQELLNAKYEDLSKLQFIDSITSRYDEKELKEKLFQKGIIESVDTPICISRVSTFGNKKEVINYRLLTSGPYSNTLGAIDGEVLMDFHDLYDNDKQFQEIANFIIGKENIGRIFYFNGYGGRAYKLNYSDARNIVLAQNIYKMCGTLSNYQDKNNDYNQSSDEIISLLEQGNTL